MTHLRSSKAPRARRRRLPTPAVSALVTLTLALVACAWTPVNWASDHMPPSLKREARAVYDAATSASPLDTTASAAIAELPAVPGAPNAFQLPIADAVSAAEPGAGIDANFSLAHATGAYDDTRAGYWDPLYATLCGPGAVSVTLAYWSTAPGRKANGEYAAISDPLMDTSSTWNDTDVDGVPRLRGYMLWLAYKVQPPGWSQPGMLPQSTWQSGEFGGATLQATRDALNWEASGENPRDWSTYFYTLQWNSAFQSQRAYPRNLYEALHSDIVSDLAFHHVPVVVEISAGYLPNWRDTNPVYHFVAITGYDDIAGTYTYLDTCKVYTGCDTAGGMDAPGLHTIDQIQLSAAVASIPTSPTTGDGGWVW